MMMMMIIIWGVPCGCCPGDQKAALLEFRSLYVGNSSAGGDFSNWNASTSCCEWSGLSCDSRHQFVMALGLLDTGFMGELLEAGVSSDVLTPLFLLTSLRYLDLSQIYIRGGIPPGIGNLTQLQKLDLSNNRFSGPIPPQLFSALPHLQQLGCDGNALEGKIPIEIGNLTNLVDVFMHGNKLSGEIPATLLQLHKLETLYLKDNFLSGEIPSVQNMTRLIDLKLDNNFLSGEVPTWVFELSMIQRLYLGRNNLTFAYAKQIAPKSRFTQVSLISCNIASNGIPLWLANQSDLETLDLRSNRMTGTFPGWLAEMHLTDLVLADNLLQDFESSEQSLSRADSSNSFQSHKPSNFRPLGK
ncbi:unnamed protein product [Linum tenue]|uniref:Leucine-rich repeat-containing N-terminal plant-type domain-containing protein n=1 Tax=Linum tenue TaxID=586396 RepID=A0AAV0NGG4_9ROSI|nr:unnamed protein product [Linum tenue]